LRHGQLITRGSNADGEAPSPRKGPKTGIVTRKTRSPKTPGVTHPQWYVTPKPEAPKHWGGLFPTIPNGFDKKPQESPDRSKRNEKDSNQSFFTVFLVSWFFGSKPLVICLTRAPFFFWYSQLVSRFWKKKVEKNVDDSNLAKQP
jgi:hypothetical protein